jgi:hypothetical protein
MCSLFARRRPVGLGLLALLLGCCGCGPGKGTLTGQVLFNNTPLPGGWVTFRPADPRANSVSAELDEKGHYSVVLPAGEVKVSIDNRNLQERTPVGGGLPPNLPLKDDVRKALTGGNPTPSPPKEGNAPKPSGRYVPIPARYYTVESSGLRFTVARGGQKHDIELTD